MIAPLVEPGISREKFMRELDLWERNALHRERGWVLLGVDPEALIVELAFLAKISTSAGSAPLPVVACAVRLSYDNYDLLPPSLTFIDAITRLPLQRTHVRALQIGVLGGGAAVVGNAGAAPGMEVRDVLIDGHPETKLPFLCLAGIREYHTHPQHTGDSWLLHRHLGEGSLSTICDRIWRYMVKTVIGLEVNVQVLPFFPMRGKLVVSLAQGEFQIQTPSPGAVIQIPGLPFQVQLQSAAPVQPAAAPLPTPEQPGGAG